MGVAWGSHEGGFGVALGWLCTPEYMPSICLVYGFAVASGGLSVQGSGFRVQGSTFGVRRSAPGRNLKHRKAACRPSAVSLAYIYEARPKLERPKVTPWESPMTARRLSHDSPVCLARSTNRFGLYNSGSWGVSRKRTLYPLEIQRAANPQSRLAHHVRINLRRRHILVAQ